MPSGRDSSGMRFAGIGVELVAAVGALMLLGWWIDRHFGTTPWGLVIGAVVGLVGGMYNLVREAFGAARASGSDKSGPGDAGPARPGAGQPGPGQPGSGKPGPSEPGSGQPGSGQPGSGA